MSIECVYLAAIDKRKHMVPSLREQVKQYLDMDLKVFWSGSGEDPAITYDRIDLPAGEELFRHSRYGAGEGRKNHANAFLSHRDMFVRILADGYNNALVLEEDIYFIPERWNKIYHSELVQDFINNESQWDGIYFGWHMEEYPGDSSECDRVEIAWKTNGIYDVERAQPSYVNICGLHAILLNKKMLERLSKIDVGPMDQYLNSNLNRFRLFYITPQIVGSLSSFSAAEGRWQNRKELS